MVGMVLLGLCGGHWWRRELELVASLGKETGVAASSGGVGGAGRGVVLPRRVRGWLVRDVASGKELHLGTTISHRNR